MQAHTRELEELDGTELNQQALKELNGDIEEPKIAYILKKGADAMSPEGEHSVTKREFEQVMSYGDRLFSGAVPDSEQIYLEEFRSYIDNYASELDVPEEIRQTAQQLFEGVNQNREPRVNAAAAVYGASYISGYDISQTELAEISDVSSSGIRRVYPEILENHWT